MTQIKLLGGFYEAKNLIANAQRCINLYPEENPPDAPFPFTFYPSPGLRRLSKPMGGGGQGLYTTIDGALYAAAGGKLYFVDNDFVPVQIGTVTAGNRVYMADNADAGAMLVVDGTSRGLNVTLSDHSAQVIFDPNFYGGTRIDFVDGYFVLNFPGKNEIYLSNPYTTTFNPLFFAGKTGGGDPVIACVALHRELWLFGPKTTEVWWNTGAVDFPYQPIQGVFIQQGLAAINSICTQDLTVYWLGQNPLGQGLVFKGNAYRAERISTHAIENKIQSYPTMSDAIGFVYQQEGHVYYVLIFPSANSGAGATWVWDEVTKLWHERASTTTGAGAINGLLNRIRPCAATQAYGQLILQDYVDGSLYTYDLTYGQDDTLPAASPIYKVRAFPHMINDGKRLEYSRFIADMQTGGALENVTNVPGALGDDINGQPLLNLRISDDRGGTWSTPQQQTFGCTGQENTQIIWTRLGVSKDRIFEVSWTTTNVTALNGGFVEVRPAVS